MLGDCGYPMRKRYSIITYRKFHDRKDTFFDDHSPNLIDKPEFNIHTYTCISLPERIYLKLQNPARRVVETKEKNHSFTTEYIDHDFSIPNTDSSQLFLLKNKVLIKFIGAA